MTEAAPGTEPSVYDLFVIGGGINGIGIARDAVGRGLSVALAEQNDLASATSSASSKLFHGGLRYLEYYEFRLVRKALREREVLLTAMPHISWPMRFVLPHHAGLRPRWLVRLGLFLYDYLGGRKILPATKRLALARHPAGALLKPIYTTAFEYSDCWIDDARLVALNARDAAGRGARIMTRTRVTRAQRVGDHWEIDTTDTNTGAHETFRAAKLVNAGGPWVAKLFDEALHLDAPAQIRLVRGSHIVIPRLPGHDQPYILQGGDGRIVFVIPYEDNYTLIGTTDVDHTGALAAPKCTDEEAAYLCDFVSEYLKTPVTEADIVWRYSGVRPLYDDGASDATHATRDYVLHVDSDGPPLLSVFGGKITTYRRLAESALAKLDIPGPWTAGVALPGGDFPHDDVARLTRELKTRFPFLDKDWAARLIRTYGTDATALLGNATSLADLGQDFGATLTEAELIWHKTHEFAQTAEDSLWRRTKLGLRLTDDQKAAVADWFAIQPPG